MNDTPLRLAVGSHVPGTGAGCAMNVESWINDDDEITDFPDCANRLLSKAVQYVNDNVCSDRTEEIVDGQPVRYLCPDCAVKVLALARRTRGTGLHDWSDSAAVWLHQELNETSQAVTVKKREDLLAWGHRVIDRYDEIVGTCETAPVKERVAQ